MIDRTTKKTTLAVAAAMLLGTAAPAQLAYDDRDRDEPRNEPRWSDQRMQDDRSRYGAEDDRSSYGSRSSHSMQDSRSSYGSPSSEGMQDGRMSGNTYIEPTSWVTIAYDTDGDGRFEAYETIWGYDLIQARTSSQSRSQSRYGDSDSSSGYRDESFGSQGRYRDDRYGTGPSYSQGGQRMYGPGQQSQYGEGFGQPGRYDDRFGQTQWDQQYGRQSGQSQYGVHGLGEQSQYGQGRQSEYGQSRQSQYDQARQGPYDMSQYDYDQSQYGQGFDQLGQYGDRYGTVYGQSRYDSRYRYDDRFGQDQSNYGSTFRQGSTQQGNMYGQSSLDDRNMYGRPRFDGSNLYGDDSSYARRSYDDRYGSSWNEQQSGRQGMMAQEHVGQGLQPSTHADMARRQGRSSSQPAVYHAAGNIRALQTVDLAGMQEPHVIATISTDQGRTAQVELGPRSTIADLDLRTGDRCEVIGTIGKLDGKAMLMADRVRHDGRTAGIRRPDDLDLHRFEGQIVALRHVQYAGMDGRNVQAKVDLRNGGTALVDLGPERKLQDANLSEGMHLQFLADEVRIGDSSALRAEQLRVNNRTVDLDRSWEREQFKGKPQDW